MATVDQEAAGQRPEPLNLGNAGLLAAYQVLATRAQATRTLTWQVPALTLASQAFLIGVSAQVQAQLPVRLLLASTILLIGAVSLFVQFKVGVYTVLDLHMLDKYENLILGQQFPDCLLHHSKITRDRENLFKQQFGDRYVEAYDSWFYHMRLARPLRLLPISVIWGGLQVVISVVGASVPLMPLFFR